MQIKHVRLIAIMAVALVLWGCTGTPKDVAPVSDFEVNRYLGKWYEIARLDHPFERGLERISATYTLREDGGIDVLNQGFNTQQNEWEDANGKAYFVDAPSIGHLKVSFFGPFYASYVIMELDKDGYEYALVTGPDRDYLWILSRTPTLPATTLNYLLDVAKRKGYAVDELIFVDHKAQNEQSGS